MPLDGLFLSSLCAELTSAKGSRIEKIYQPSHDRFVFNLRGKNYAKKLLVTVGGEAPRVCFTDLSFENPQTPSALCMLIRKYFQSAKLERVEQLSLDRVLTLTFSSLNEMGDEVEVSAVIELMGRQSNLIFTQNGKIIDAVKRSSPENDSRLILPGASYVYPQIRDKENIFTCDLDLLCLKINNSGEKLSKAIMNNLEGVSPLISREICLMATGDLDADTPAENLKSALEYVKAFLLKGRGYIIGNRDFSFMPINQYGEMAKSEQAGTPSEALDLFYKERTLKETMRRKSSDLSKLVSALVERTARKIEKQKGELSRCADKENLRIFGELIKANIYRIERGAEFIEVENYYENPMTCVKIPLSPELSPTANAQKYFKEYKKAHTAEDMLASLIEKGEKELYYLQSVADVINRAESEKELSEIKAELIEGGYIRIKLRGYKAPKPLAPMEYEKNGFKILVGRNNLQNDKLTLKQASKSDLWLHTKEVHGSHVIIQSEGRQIPDDVIVYGAGLAAYHSKGRQADKVAVDYCPVKNVKKPSGAKPGMVIYNNYNTVYVTPIRE